MRSVIRHENIFATDSTIMKTQGDTAESEENISNDKMDASELVQVAAASPPQAQGKHPDLAPVMIDIVFKA